MVIDQYEVSSDFDLEKVKQPSDMFSLFVPSEEKMKVFAQHLMDDYLYVSDEFRNYETIWKMLFSYTSSPNHLLYEIGDFYGIIGFTDILPMFKCNVMLKFWNPKRWGPDFARQGKELIHYIGDIFGLRRINTSSPDPKIVKMCKMVGFGVDGISKNAFAWNGDLFDLSIMSIIKEQSKDCVIKKVEKKKNKRGK